MKSEERTKSGGAGSEHRPIGVTWRVALVIASAGLHALAFPPWDFTPIAFVAIVPFLYAIRDLRPWQAALLGHLWGSAAIWGVASWVPSALVFYYQQPWWFGVLFCLIGCQILWGFYYAFFAACTAWLRPKGFVLRPLVLSALWVTCELGRAQLLTGEPWMLLGYALSPHPMLIQAADLGGVYLLSFVVIFINASLAEILTAPATTVRSVLQISATPVLLILALMAYSQLRLSQPLPLAPSVPVDVIQGNNDVGTRWRSEFYGAGLERYLKMSLAAARKTRPEIIVWPESAVTFFLAYEPDYLKVVGKLLEATGADLIVGSPHHDGATDERDPNYFNSAFYMTSEGELTSRYDKTHLLPFAEYFPLRFIEFLRRRFERVRYFAPGNGKQLLATRAGSAAVVICFEAIFPEIVRAQMRQGAKLLFNLSNDVWLGRGAGAEQHLAMVVLRAVENHTWVIRSTTTGISAIIDPHGRITAQTKQFEPAVLDGRVVPMQVDTPYKHFGDVFAYLCVLASMAAGAGRLRK